jgi:hypothetical protein
MVAVLANPSPDLLCAGRRARHRHASRVPFRCRRFSASIRRRRASSCCPPKRRLFILFDILLDASGRSPLESPLSERRCARKVLCIGEAAKRAQALVVHAKAHRENGCVRVALDLTAWLRSTATGLTCRASGRCCTVDCVVGGFRYGTGSRQVRSLLPGLYDSDGKLDHVSFTSTISNKHRGELTAQLEPLSSPPASRERRRAGYRALRRGEAAQAKARGRGRLRPGHRQPPSSWHQVRTFQSR